MAQMPVIGIYESRIGFNNVRERELFRKIQGRGGRLRTSGEALRKVDGEAYYVWRMLAFNISPNGQHHCMPVTADFYLKVGWDERESRIKELDALVSKIQDQVPKEQWYGTFRWGRIFGMI